MDMRPDVWPVAPERVARLEHFRRSRHFPRPAAARAHDVSEFWRGPVSRIYGFSRSEAAIGIVSLAAFRDPEHTAARRATWSRVRQGVAGRVLGALARATARIPQRRWKGLAALAARGSRFVELVQERREYELATRAFAQASRGHVDPVLRLDTLHAAPLLADQFEASPAMTLYIASMINALGPHLVRHGVKHILEIGPGDAALAVSLHHLFGCRFILVDLPEVFNLSFALISYYAPKAEVALPDEVGDLGEGAWTRDFVLLCPEQADLIPAGAVDGAINASSFQEMTYPLITGYFQVIERCLRPGGLFYCLNAIRFSRHPDGSVIEFAKYPWPEGFQDIFYEDVEYMRALGADLRKHRLQIKGQAS